MKWILLVLLFFTGCEEECADCDDCDCEEGECDAGDTVIEISFDDIPCCFCTCSKIINPTLVTESIVEMGPYITSTSCNDHCDTICSWLEYDVKTTEIDQCPEDGFWTQHD